jgi:cytochrome P450
MMPLLYNFTLDTATDFLFGESIESQKVAIAARNDTAMDKQAREAVAAQIEKAQEFTSSFAIANEYMLRRIRLQSLYFLGDSFKFRKAVRRIRRVTDRYVELACDTASSSEKPEGKKQSLMFNLANQTQDRVELRNQTLSILLAGRDTTASLLGWALTRLALHPEVFDKLRDTVLQDFESGTDITFAQLKGCRYLQHFLNEVLRLHPTVPLNQRIATKDTTLPTGGGPDQRSPIAVKRGQIVLFSVYNMQRREQLWGADAAEFKPERWEQRFPAWQFLPFLGGPRICLGQQ